MSKSTEEKAPTQQRRGVDLSEEQAAEFGLVVIPEIDFDNVDDIELVEIRKGFGFAAG